MIQKKQAHINCEKYCVGKVQEGQKNHWDIFSPAKCPAIECLKYTGLDYVVIDMEHSPVTAEGASQNIAAANGAGMAAFVGYEISRRPVLKMLDDRAQP
jgi:4-hydroxy-2-oxoheptanedioate aldolase